jgi:hypothetical protein
MTSTEKLVELLNEAIEYKKGKRNKPNDTKWRTLAAELDVIQDTCIFEMQKVKDQLIFDPSPLDNNRNNSEYELCDVCGSYVLAHKPCFVCRTRARKSKK